jgi:Zn-dependent peptidase ImmA (M78 family)
MTNIQNWMHDYSVEFGGDKNSFAASLKSTMTIQSMANAIRRYLNIDVLWFKTKESGNNPGQKFNFLRAKIQELDIIVMMSGIVGTNTKRSLDINEFRAFTMIDDYVPLIFINANDSYSGRLFSLMHELTHVGIGVNSLFNDYKMDNMDNLEKYSDIEKTCNAVAAEIFVPIIFFIEMWKSIKGADVSKKIAKIADYFNVSKLVIAHRALDQKFISQHEYNEIDFKPQQNYRNTDTNTYGDSINLFFSRYDRNCLSRIKQCVETGYLLYTDAYRLTGLSRTFFDKVIAEVIKNGS